MSAKRVLAASGKVNPNDNPGSTPGATPFDDPPVDGPPKELLRLMALYEDIYAEFIQHWEKQGLCFEPTGSTTAEAADLLQELNRARALSRFGAASISVGALSPACHDCATASSRRSRTFQLSFACHRSCYYCLNPDLRHRDGGAVLCDAEQRHWREEMAELASAGTRLSHVALSGGEPLLFKGETVDFFSSVKECFPEAWTRLYTSGDLLEPSDLGELSCAGLDEIRFGLKPDDEPELHLRLLELMGRAKRAGLVVTVEMPVIPHTRDFMEDLLRRLDSIGIDHINLLEFCWPLHNWREFKRRGFMIRRPPFDILYPYRYAGGLPVAGSEPDCLALILFAIAEGLSLGLHYCSLAHKHREQVYEQNHAYATEFPDFDFSQEDFFLWTCKVFGNEVEAARRLLDACGEGYSLDTKAAFLQCRPYNKEALAAAELHPALSCCIVESRGERTVLRELALRL